MLNSHMVQNNLQPGPVIRQKFCHFLLFRILVSSFAYPHSKFTWFFHDLLIYKAKIPRYNETVKRKLIQEGKL